MRAAPTPVSGCVDETQQQHINSPNDQICTFGSRSSGSFEALEPGAGSTWYRDSYDDEADVLTIDDIVGQLVGSKDAETTLTLLQQLIDPSTHLHGCMVNCDAWQPLLQLLPGLLRSPCRTTAAAAEQLLLQQLAPELLDCAPEPLAEMLIALLTAALPTSCPACAANGAATAPVAERQHGAAPELPLDDSSRQALGTAAGMAASSSCTCHLQQQLSQWSNVVVQVVRIGLHKLGRQWHFLDEHLAQQVCGAVVEILRQPFVLYRKQEQQQGCGEQQCMQQGDGQAVQQQQQQQQQGSGACTIEDLPSHQQGLQQQQQQHLPGAANCLAEQLLIADPSLGWWHRLHANSKSCKQVKAAAVSSGLLQQLLIYAASDDMPSSRLEQHSSGQLLQSYHVPGSVGGDCAAAAAAAVQESCEGPAEASNGCRLSSSNSSSGLLRCLATQLLAAFASSPSGRQLLAAQAQMMHSSTRAATATGGHAGSASHAAVNSR